MTKDEAVNIAIQCRVTASNKISESILVDAGSGTLKELLSDAARAIESTHEIGETK